MKRWSNVFLCAMLFLATFPNFVFAEEQAKMIAITFDDGPGNYTEQLLDTLKERDIKVTFFVVGNRIAAFEDIVLREYQEGHQVASHTFTHPDLKKLSEASIRQEMVQTTDAIKALTGQEKVYFRPPYGNYNNTVIKYADGPIILWSVDTLDWKYRNAQTVRQNIVNGAKDGAIILLHDIHPTSVAGAIMAIDDLRQQGYEFVTVEDLLRRNGGDESAGKVYSSVKRVKMEEMQPKEEEHWAYPSAEYLKGKGIMWGLDDSTFGMDQTMTRAMTATVLFHLSGEQAVAGIHPFVDLEAGSWYEDAAIWTYARGLMYESEEAHFLPNEGMTIQKFGDLLKRYAYYSGQEVDEESLLADLNGATGDTMTTRGHAAVILHRFIEQQNVEVN